MKKLALIISALALLMGMSQCTKQRPEMPQYSGSVGDMYIQHVTVNASHGSGNSKVTGSQIGTELKLKWQTGDKLHVYNQTHPEMATEPLTLKGESGSSVGQFEGSISGATGDNLTFYYKGISAEVICNEGAVTYAASNFLGQDGILDGDNGIFKRMLIMKKDVAFPLGSGTLELKVPYAIFKFDLKALGTAGGNTVTISADGSTVASVTGVTNAVDNPYYVAVPADGTEVEYRFIGNGKVFKKKWTVTPNTFYTKSNGSGGSTGEAIVIEGSSLVGPSSVTTTAGCSGSIYVMGGTVTLPSGAAQQVEYGFVYSQGEPVPEIGKAGCSMIVGGTESFPIGTTNFSVDITGLTTGVTYRVRAYAIGVNGNVVYAPNDSDGIKTIVGDNPMAVNWNGGGTPGASPYEFTVDMVSSGFDEIPVKVRFSQGNLQYVGGSSKWKFAQHQFDIIGDNGQGSTSETATRDLFGWGTNGINHGAVCYQPWNTNQVTSDYYAYGSDSKHLYSETPATADWGYNAIYAGSTATTGWRTLKQEEWGYLLGSTSPCRTNAANLYGQGKVGCTNGLIILPDDWDWEEIKDLGLRYPDGTGGLKFTVGRSVWLNTYSYSDWSTMERHGAVFLPTAGYRGGTSVYYVGSYGYYWSSSCCTSLCSYSLFFYSDYVYPQYYYNRFYGFSVRLVR